MQFLHEKEGGNPRPAQYMQAFQEAIDDCGLHDMGFIGDPFTWRRGRIRERLDRGLVNDAWANLFTDAALQNLEFNHSDHRPLLVDTKFYTHSTAGQNNMQVKRFEARWLRERSFEETVTAAWNDVTADLAVTNIYDKLNKMHNKFHDWDQRVFKKPKKCLRKAQRDLERVLVGPMDDENEEKRRELSKLVEYLLELEEIQLRQQSIGTWLKAGDRNTAFFQAFASARRKRNFIKRLRSEAGDWLEGTDDLNAHILNYFSHLFSSKVQQTNPVIMERVQRKVSDQMNNILMAPYTAEDVKKAISSIGDIKAPGPDGLHAIFFKKYWQRA